MENMIPMEEAKVILSRYGELRFSGVLYLRFHGGGIRRVYGQGPTLEMQYNDILQQVATMIWQWC